MALLGFAERAQAAQDCTALPNPVYAVGASTPASIFATVALALASASPPQTLVYQESDSCTGVADFTSTPGTPTQISGTAYYWAAATGTTAQSCTFGGAVPNPQTPDLAISGVYGSSCGSALPSGVGDFIGPIQSFAFIVPSKSSANAISAEAAYFLFGFPGSSTYQVTPWTAGKQVFTRSSTAGAAVLFALTLGIPVGDISDATVFNQQSSNGNVLKNVAGTNTTGTTQTIDETIGIVSVDSVYAAPTNLSILPYQHFGQQCGWLPSSTTTLHDQINVRNGHYVPWANIHFITDVDSNGVPTDAAAKSFIGYFTGTSTPPAGVDIDTAVVKGGGVIDCAMEVKRTSDLGSLEPYAPAEPCGCFFEYTATGSTSCQACGTADAGSCPVNAPNCRKGFCEVN